MLTSQTPLIVNSGIFAAASAGVWYAGSALALYADTISDRLKLAKAFIGLVFLATATSLPEIATTFTAAVTGSSSLVLNNLFGGIALQTAILALTDALVVRGALTSYPRKPTHALEAALLIVLLTMLVAVCIMGERPVVFGVGTGAICIGVAYAGAIWLLRLYDKEGDWVPVDLPEELNPPAAPPPDDGARHMSTNSLLMRSALAAIAILVCGVLLVQAAEAIAVQTELGTSFIGVTLLAAATSLPELSTTIAAARIGAFTMAISNIFGSNLIMLVLVLPADMLYRDGAILETADRPELLALTAGILVTAVYVVGLLVRRKPRILGMGVDSACVLALYAVSVVILYFAR